MQVPLFNQAGEEISQIELRDDIFGIEPNTAVMHQAYLRQHGERAPGQRRHQNARRSSRRRQEAVEAKRHRACPSGFHPRPALEGRRRVFGPHPRSYEQKMPKKMRHLALKSALGCQSQENQIKVIDEFTLDRLKTRDMSGILTASESEPSVLILLPEANDDLDPLGTTIWKTSRRFARGYLNVRDLLGFRICADEQGSLERHRNFF